MRTYLILALVGAACLCVVVAGEAMRRSDARLLASQESRVDDRHAADAEQRRVAALLEEARAELQRTKDSVTQLEAALDKSNAATANARRVRDTARAELKAADDRLEKAYKDIAEMENQLVQLSRVKNELERRLLPHDGYPPHSLEPEEDDPKIDGVVLGVSDKVNLVLISAGSKEGVRVGFKFTVYRGDKYISKLIVDKVEDGWAACRELTDFRKEKIEQGDKVSTRVFD